MGLKALAVAALQECAPRTLPSTLPESSSAQYRAETDRVRTLPDPVAIAAIAMTSLTDAEKAARLADLRRDPAIARFWALVWPEATNPTSKHSP